MEATRSKALKVGIVLDDSLDTPDGVQQYILTVGTWLKAQGHEVHYLVGQTKRSDIPNVHSLGNNVKVRFNGNRMSMPLPASKAAIHKLLRREDFDVLHVQLPYSPFLAGRIISAAPERTAIVGTFHIAPHSKMVQLANALLKVLTAQSLKRFDQIMSVSPVAQVFAKKTFNIDSSIVPNAVRLDLFRSAAPLATYKDKTTVLFLGRLVPRKGCRELLEAIQYVQQHELTKRQYRVVVCGKGPLEEELQRYVIEHGLQELVSFTGFIEEADKPRYLSSADIAVFPSTGGESFGIVVVEALAAVRGAVIAGDNPGYAALLGRHKEALFHPSDTKAFAEHVAMLLDDPAARANAHVWQLEEAAQYDVSIVGEQILATYRAALHKRSA